MTTFYANVILDPQFPDKPDQEIVNFSIEAENMLAATRILAVYLKGRFEGSGRGGEISHIGRTKVRGQGYRGL
jgi:hypothetical protein